MGRSTATASRNDSRCDLQPRNHASDVHGFCRRSGGRHDEPGGLRADAQARASRNTLVLPQQRRCLA